MVEEDDNITEDGVVEIMEDESNNEEEEEEMDEQGRKGSVTLENIFDGHFTLGAKR